jgi:hypothetical protein
MPHFSSFPWLSHLNSWLSFSLLHWGLGLPAREVGLHRQVGWQLCQNTPGRSSGVKWQLVIVWWMPCLQVCKLPVTLACAAADYVLAGYISWLPLYVLSLPWRGWGGDYRLVRSLS